MGRLSRVGRARANRSDAPNPWADEPGRRATKRALSVRAGVAHPPDRIGGVVAEHQGSVRRFRDSDRPSPYVAVVHDEPGYEVLVLAFRVSAAIDRHPDHLVAGPDRAVPRPMFGGEDVAAIFRGKLTALIKGDLQRRIVRLQQHIGHDGDAGQLRMLARVAGILVGTQVPPGPSIEPSSLNVRDVVRHQVVAQPVAFVYGAPELPVRRVDGQTRRIAYARGVDAS